jgi:cytoplasmic polyadenylation element-binding protein
LQYSFAFIHVSFVNAGKSPFFPGLEEQAALLEDPGSHLVDGQVLPQPAPPRSSPSRSSPHSQGSETGERYSRKVFVGGLPPDIDEGMLVEAAIYMDIFNT